MSFPVTNQVPEGANAVVTFTGLLIVHYDEDAGSNPPRPAVKVGIHPDPNHLLRLKIEVRQRGSNEFREIVWEHVYPPVLQQNLLISVINPELPFPLIPPLARFQRPGPLNRGNAPTPLFDPELSPATEDFRFAMNPGIFHQTRLTFSAKAFKPHIRLENGLFYATSLLNMFEADSARVLHSRANIPLVTNPAIEDAGIQPHFRLDKTMELKAVARAIGVNLYHMRLVGNIVLQWIDVPAGVSPESLPPLPSLERLPANHYYRIMFDNDCRNTDNTVCKAELRAQGMFSDLPLYYQSDLIQSLPAEGILDFRERPDAAGDDIPCIPITG